MEYAFHPTVCTDNENKGNMNLPFLCGMFRLACIERPAQGRSNRIQTFNHVSISVVRALEPVRFFAGGCECGEVGSTHRRECDAHEENQKNSYGMQLHSSENKMSDGQREHAWFSFHPL
jgi:hypothetical protein